MQPHEIRVFFDYNFWAFERVWDCIKQLTDEQFAEPVDYSTGSIQAHVIHLASSIHRRLQQLQGNSVPLHLKANDFPTLRSAKAKWDEIKAETYAYLAAISEADLDGSVPGISPETGTTTEDHRWEILLHMINHATDHRSQILAVLHFHFGVNTIGQDMMAFLAERRQT